MALWSWVSAACQGTSHKKTGLPLQDAYKTSVVNMEKNSYFLAVVSDGAGSASHGGKGAAIVCRTFSVQVRKFLKEKDHLPSEVDINLWLDLARDRIIFAATKRSLTPRDFAATMILVVTNGDNLIVAHIGDGCAVIKDSLTNLWVAPTWPDHGEYASTTYFVTDDTEVKLRIAEYSGDITSVAVFSDGLERLVLDFTEKTPSDGFFEAMIKPIMAGFIKGKNRELSLALQRYLDGDSVNERTDDDKSLVIAVKQ